MTTRPLEQRQTVYRAIQHADYEALAALHGRLSETSLYWRYLRHTAPSRDELVAMCAVGSRGMAVMSGQQMVGFGYYVPQNTKAEMALLIEDNYQRQGLGSRLFQEIANHARWEGITTFEAIASADNRGLVSLLRRSGLEYRSEFAYGFREITINLGQ